MKQGLHHFAPIAAELKLLLIYKEFANIFQLSPKHQLDHQLGS